MAKTYPWSTIVPSGSEQASTADDHFRRLRLEIEERMNDIVVDWSTDPVVLKPVGGVDGKVLTIHSSEFMVEPEEDATVEYGDTGVTVAPAVGPMRASAHLPVDSILRRMRALCTIDSGAIATIALKRMTFDTSLELVTIAILTSTSTGTQMLDTISTPFSHTVSAGAYFVTIDVSGSNGIIFHGVQLTYDAPDARATL